MKGIPFPARRSGSTSICISRSRPPASSTSRTPCMPSISSFMPLAVSLSSRRPILPETASTKIGISDILTSKTEGSSSRSDGSSRFAISTLSLTHLTASSISVPVTNSTTIRLAPSLDLDFIFLTFLTPLSFSSILMVMEVSISPGATPRYEVETKTYGILTSGALSRGSLT